MEVNTMRTQEEMRLAVHNRMRELQRRRDNRLIAVAGSSCATLVIALVALIARFGGLRHEVLSSEYAGASLLADDVGGYVLVALAAFMAGAAIVAFLRARKKAQDRESDKGE